MEICSREKSIVSSHGPIFQTSQYSFSGFITGTLKSLFPLVPHILLAQEMPLPAGQSHCQDEVARDHASQALGTFVLGSDYSDTVVS